MRIPERPPIVPLLLSFLHSSSISFFPLWLFPNLYLSVDCSARLTFGSRDFLRHPSASPQYRVSAPHLSISPHPYWDIGAANPNIASPLLSIANTNKNRP